MTAAHVKHVRAALERHHGKLTAMTNAHHQAAAQAAKLGAVPSYKNVCFVVDANEIVCSVCAPRGWPPADKPQNGAHFGRFSLQDLLGLWLALNAA